MTLDQSKKNLIKQKNVLRRQKQLLQIYKKGGKTHHEVAELSGYSYPQVVAFYNQHKYLHELPPVTRKWYRGRAPELTRRWREAYLDYQAGLTLAAVGEKYGGFTREYVKQVFRRHGLKTRGPGAPRNVEPPVVTF